MTTREATADNLCVEPSDTGLILSFRGRFGFGIDQWAYLPFEVPRGIARIDVDTSHDRFSMVGVARNVLDLGIFDPAGFEVGDAAGFRGWSGGARSGFVLATTTATPGYLAGPIDAGRWVLALGPVVLNPLGMDWQARIVLTRGEQLPVGVATEPVTVSDPGGGSRWYRGDLHLHTVHSDGRYEVGELAAEAQAAGLDFIVSTDHNTNSANRAWAATDTHGLLVVSGEEVTTRHGHWLAVGLPPNGWVDWRYAPRDGVFTRYAGQVRAEGGLVVAAHPAVPLPGSAWEFGYRDVDALEVWNGMWNVDDEVSLRIWHRLLCAGRRIAAVGGSDSHGPHQPVGRPQTAVNAAGSTPAELVDALRRGRCYLTESSDVTVTLGASCPVGDGVLTAGPGETLPVPPDTSVTVAVQVRGAPDTRLSVITAAGCVRRTAIDGCGVGSVQWTGTPAEARFARVEVRHAGGMRFPSMVALTNPVWLSAVRDQP